MYKVVTRKLESISMMRHACVIYSTEKFVTAPEPLAKHGYHLLCFDTEQNARRAVFQYCWRADIWEVEALEEVPLPPSHMIRIDMFDILAGTIEPTLNLSANTSSWPQGTRMFKQVKLVRRLP